jgi:D-sedoheptulose 7-phosphate isomerase
MNTKIIDPGLDKVIKDYQNDLTTALKSEAMNGIEELCTQLLLAWRNGRSIYLCGNGGSAGNAIHLANDFIYGAGKSNLTGLRVEALSANSAVITCLGNDIGYQYIYSEQIRVKANRDDILIALSGSGNSQNIINALDVANQKGVKTFAILGYSGGLCKDIASFPIHFEVFDMQVSEDMQLIVGHICMKWLARLNLNEIQYD